MSDARHRRSAGVAAKEAQLRCRRRTRRRLRLWSPEADHHRALAHFEGPLVEAVEVALGLARSPVSRAFLLEAVGAVVLARCGAILDEHVHRPGAAGGLVVFSGRRLIAGPPQLLAARRFPATRGLRYYCTRFRGSGFVRSIADVAALLLLSEQRNSTSSRAGE